MSDLARYETLVAEFDFDELMSFIDGERQMALRRFEILIEAATPLNHDKAMAIWIAKVRADVPNVNNQERFVSAFAKSLTTAQKKAAELVGPVEVFYYDGLPVVRPPRVFHVPLDAGRAPVGTNYGKARQHLAAYSQKDYDADMREFVVRLKRVVAWLDRDEGSAMDMCGFVDFHTRAAHAHVESKRKFLKKLNAQMRDIERRAKSDDEFDEEAWKRLSSLKEAVIRSGYMVKDVLDAFHTVRSDTYAYTGRSMSTFRSWSDMKKDKDQYRKMQVTIIDADKLVGLTPEEFAVFRRVTGADLNGTLTDLPDDSPMADRIGGVNALPDEMIAGNARDVANNNERNRRREKGEAAKDRRYERKRPKAVPKTDVSFPPSGEPGSLHRALTAAIKSQKQA